MKKICSFKVIVERVPMLTPIGIIWDKANSSWTIGIMVLCFVIGIQFDRCNKESDEL